MLSLDESTYAQSITNKVLHAAFVLLAQTAHCFYINDMYFWENITLFFHTSGPNTALTLSHFSHFFDHCIYSLLSVTHISSIWSNSNVFYWSKKKCLFKQKLLSLPLHICTSFHSLTQQARKNIWNHLSVQSILQHSEFNCVVPFFSVISKHLKLKDCLLSTNSINLIIT